MQVLNTLVLESMLGTVFGDAKPSVDTTARDIGGVPVFVVIPADADRVVQVPV